MNKEKYVDSIIRKLKCTRQKKKEIRKQLISDLAVAYENVEDKDDIVSRMGAPEEIAKEFNDNFTEDEIKKAKRYKNITITVIILLAFVLIAALIYWILPKGKLVDNGKSEQDNIEEMTKKVIELVSDGDYETVCNDYCDKQMQKYMNSEKIESAKKFISDDWGKLTSYGNFYITEMLQMNKKFTVVQVSVSYENTSVTYTITFNEKIKVSGFYIK